MIEEIRNKAKELLKNKKVDLIIGYQEAADGVSAIPSLVADEEGALKLIWNERCVHNLSVYLKDFPEKKKGIIAKACDVKSITVLLQENQLKREEVFIIAVKCLGVINERESNAAYKQGGQIDFSAKCKNCASPVPFYYDILIGGKEEKTEISQVEQDEYEPVRKLEAKSREERLKFWQNEFSMCIRCYACRQVCPLCYCPKCVADQTMPAYFQKGAGLEGNFSWNVVRAMHLAGRCIDCGECERACPVHIPLRQLNKKIEKDIKELFHYEAGREIGQKPLLSCFDKTDPADFIK